MMKRIALALLLLLPLASSAPANVPCTLPFNLQNGQPADATQVMANYNALVTCLTQAAAAGVNSDITALTALSAPIAPAGGGTPVFTGGTSTGSANAQVVGTTVPTFAPAIGYQVTFTAGFTNNTAMTLQVGASPPFAVFRRSQLGATLTVGGEVIAGQRVTVAYDGTQYQIVSDGIITIGEIRDFAGATPPLGWAFIDGSCQPRTGAFVDLFGIIGTLYDPTGSTCDVAHFALPDGRGRVLAGRDNMGLGPANRLTNTGTGNSNCNGVNLGGAGCGAQTVVLVGQNMPDYFLFLGGLYVEGSTLSWSQGGTATVSISDTRVWTTPAVNIASTGYGPGGLGAAQNYGSGTQPVSVASGSITASPAITGTITGQAVPTLTGGSPAFVRTTYANVQTNPGPFVNSQPVMNLPPLQVVNKIIKY